VSKDSNISLTIFQLILVIEDVIGKYFPLKENHEIKIDRDKK